ncbi:MAG: LPS export ABC transporter periplasmic protein LptC [Gammaproteobacteria bacterium]|nr:LPS export ABC transporter periplasmic protein LptC [Gammaproteobacteria bacterium]HJO12084.1 LPS export ABC transporter periplasmic protein LptC [Gammaproteobacteria bacterium]
MTRLPMQRFYLLIIPAIVAIALFAGINTFETVINPDAPISNTVTVDFDGYSEGINTVLYNQQGQIDYNLQARSQTHFLNDITELNEPFIRFYQNGNSRWNIVANSGRIFASSTRPGNTTQSIELAGNVEIVSLDQFGNRTVVATELITIDPDLKTIETEEPVLVVTNDLEQTSIGMYADLIQDEIVLKSNVRGIYANPPQ